MASHDEVDSYLIKMGIPYEQVGEGTWVVHPEGEHRAQIGVTIEAPIVLFSIPMFDLAGAHAQREELFRTLLELNADLLHSSYRLEDGRIVLTGAQQLENLDFNEFQAVVDDMCIALDNHIDKIAPLVQRGANTAAAAGGST